MKIIDEKGRLFGKINIIDFLVILFLLCILPGFYFGYQILTERPRQNTELYKDGLAKGVIKYDFWKAFAENPIERYRLFQPQVWTESISQEELFRLVNVGYRQFYIRLSYILKSLIKTKSVKELLSKVHGGWVLLKEIAYSPFNGATKCENC